MTVTFEIRSGAATLAAEADGEGPGVVLLHAGVADRRMWRAQIATLAGSRPSFHAVAYDRRGFGDTLHADETWSHVRDLGAVLDVVAPRASAILVGCSQGGRIAIDFALENPSRVGALVLVAPAIGGAPEPASFPPAIEAWIARMERAHAAEDVDAINAAEAHAWLDGPLAREGRVSGASRELFLAMNDIALRAESRGVEVHPPPAYPRIGAIAQPTLVVCGELDFPSVVEQCRWLAGALPYARLRIMHGAAHLPSLEQAEAFNEILVPFCEANR